MASAFNEAWSLLRGLGAEMDKNHDRAAEAEEGAWTRGRPTGDRMLHKLWNNQAQEPQLWGLCTLDPVLHNKRSLCREARLPGNDNNKSKKCKCDMSF